MAREYFEKSLTLDPNYAPAQNGMADTYVSEIALVTMVRAERVAKMPSQYPSLSLGWVALAFVHHCSHTA